MASNLLLSISLHLLLLLPTAQFTSASVPSPFPTFEIVIKNFNDDNGAGSNIYTHKLEMVTLIIAILLIIGFTFLGVLIFVRGRSSFLLSFNAERPLPVSSTCKEIRSGLDPAAIDAFPMLTYSAVTALNIGKETLECAICLCDFAEEEFLRVLPNCCHVFHPECVGTWLECHVTCPVCRDNLEVDAIEKPGRREQLSFDLEMDLDLDLRRMGRFHSMGQVTKRDRHRLVLPEHVMKELAEAGRLRKSGEVAVLKGGEGSGRRGFRGLSDRWTAVLLSGVFIRGDGSVRKGENDGDGDGDGDGEVKDIEKGSCSHGNTGGVS